MEPKQPPADKDEEKARIADAFRSNYSLWEIDRSFLGRAERFATDSLFQWLCLRVLEWRATISPDSRNREFEETNPTSDAFANAHLAWVFGRPLTPAALALCRYLKNRGTSTRDLRLGVFCRHVRNDGTVRRNWWKERFLLACGVLLLTLNVAGFIQLGLQLVNTSVAILLSLSVAATVSLLLLGIQYPLLLLTIRAPRVAHRLERIWATRT